MFDLESIENQSPEQRFEQITGSIAALINEKSAALKKPVLLKVYHKGNNMVFELIKIDGSLIQAMGMYEFLINSSRAGMNMVQRLQLSGSLKIKAMRDLYQQASTSFEKTLILQLSEILSPMIEGEFLLFGISMGNLKAAIFKEGKGVGDQVREVSLEELYELFNFQKVDPEGTTEEE